MPAPRSAEAAAVHGERGHGRRRLGVGGDEGDFRRARRNRRPFEPCSGGKLDRLRRIDRHAEKMAAVVVVLGGPGVRVIDHEFAVAADRHMFDDEVARVSSSGCPPLAGIE